MSTTGTVTLSGFFSGMDTETIISKLKAVAEIPITNLESQVTDLDSETSAYNYISSSLSNLLDTLSALNDTDLFNAKTVASSSTSVGTATVDTTAASGSTNITITQVATSSFLKSGTDADSQLSTAPAASSTISSISGMDVSNKTFTINGVSITLTGSEVIDDGNASSTDSVIGKINNSGAGVTATYDSSTGKFTLTSNTSSTIILGSGADTSNFLTEAQLFNNSSTSVTSSLGIGRVGLTTALSSASLATTPTAGTFYVNGVELTYSAGDTLQSLITKINSSSAGVLATYDSYTDRITLTSSKRGSQGITVTDGTSNIASALKLTSATSTFTLGKSTKFTVGNDTTVRESADETLTASELGLTGVTFTAIGTGTTTLTVSADATQLQSKLSAFVEQYNSTQNLIQSYIKVDTSDTTQNGVLASDTTVSFLPSDLRGIFSYVASGNSSIRMLSDLGIDTNSDDNTVTTVDSSKLQSALADHLDELKSLFLDSSTGLIAQLKTRINNYADSTKGSITLRTQNIKDQKSRIEDQITVMQSRVDTEVEYWRTQFAAMEEAYSSSSSILSILSSNTSTTSSSK